MNMPTDTYVARSRRDLDPILDALAEINVQLRQVLQISRNVIWELESRSTGEIINTDELESKNESILANMARTEEAILNMNREISALLRGKERTKCGPGPARAERIAQIRLVP